MGKKRETTSGSRQMRIVYDAWNDIEEISDFIAFEKQQPLTAVQIVRTIWQVIYKIEVSPFSFKECEEIPTNTKMYRRAVCLSWLIIYKITAKEIIILGIIHAGRKRSKIRRLGKRK
jgi:hypothetical protein